MVRTKLAVQLFVSIAVALLGLFIAVTAVPAGIGWTLAGVTVPAAPVQAAIGLALAAVALLLGSRAVTGLTRRETGHGRVTDGDAWLHGVSTGRSLLAAGLGVILVIGGVNLLLGGEVATPRGLPLLLVGIAAFVVGVALVGWAAYRIVVNSRRQ